MNFCVNLKRLVADFGGSRRLVKRMVGAGWITVVQLGGPGRETLYDYASAQTAYVRLKNGEQPQPIEQSTKEKNLCA